MECRPGLAWFLHDKRNNLGDVGYCDGSYRKLYLWSATEILDEDCFEITSGNGARQRKIFDWFCLKVLGSLDNPVTLQDLGEVLEEQLLAAYRGESDLDYYLYQRLLENLRKACLKRVLRIHELKFRVLEKEGPATGFDYCSHRIHLLDQLDRKLYQLERKLHERRQHLRTERRERQSMLHMHSPHEIHYLPKYISGGSGSKPDDDIDNIQQQQQNVAAMNWMNIPGSMNCNHNFGCMTVSGMALNEQHSLEDTYQKPQRTYGAPVINFTEQKGEPELHRETSEHVGEVFLMQGAGNGGSSTNSIDNQSSDHDAAVVKPFIVDSGMSVHATGDLTLFSYLEDTTTNMRLCTANGLTLGINGQGTLRHHNITLHGVLFAPGLAVNIVSVSKLGDRRAALSPLLVNKCLRLSIVETREIAEHIQADQCSYNTRYVALHRVLWNKKVVCKEVLELLCGVTNGSWFTADLASVAYLIWWLLTGFLNLMRPYLDALSPSIEYSVIGSADGGVYIKNVSSRMHAPKYSREVDSVSKADSLEAMYKFIHMMNGAQAINAGQPMHLFILDSGSPFHCTGDGSLFSVDYTEAPPDRYIYGANGKGMRVHGVGSIRNDKIQVQEVLYVPELNQQPNINKTLISVNKLTKLGYRVNFGGTIFGMGGIGKKTLSQLLPTPKHMMSVRHPLIQMVLFARKRFEDMSCSINFMGPKNMFTMARRLCSFALANVCGAEWASAKLKPESLYDGMGSESVLRENTGRSNKLTENEAQRNSAPVSCGAEHGMKAMTTKITSASWVVATAAPHHATGNRDLLQGFVTEHDDQFVHAVDGVPMPVKARGAVVTYAVVLHDVWFVPGLKSNMVSVSQLAELGYSIGFGCGECCIRSAGDGKIVGKAGLGKDGLYKLDFLKVSLAM